MLFARMRRTSHAVVQSDDFLVSRFRSIKRHFREKTKQARDMSSVASHPLQSPSTLMLPYGYQIDLDFIKYCENLSQPDQSDVELQRRQRRRQRQSMEVMLGIQLEMQNQMDQLSEIWERKPPEPPPRTHHHPPMETLIVPHMIRHRRQSDLTSWDRSLNDVVDDFEKTLERSKKGKDRMNRSRTREYDETGKCRLWQRPRDPKNIFSHLYLVLSNRLLSADKPKTPGRRHNCH